MKYQLALNSWVDVADRIGLHASTVSRMLSPDGLSAKPHTYMRIAAAAGIDSEIEYLKGPPHAPTARS